MLHPVTLLIHRAERTDRLADGLGDLLGEPLPDPFAQEVVVVPARGVERRFCCRNLSCRFLASFSLRRRTSL